MSDIIVSPELFPVSIAEVEALEKTVVVPAPLKAYWRDFGCGFFIEDLEGNLITDTVANRLIDPVEVLDLLENAWDLADEFKHGLPFFEMNDRRYVLIDPQGKIVNAEIELRVIAESFDEFMYRIVREPFFYDAGLDDAGLEIDKDPG